MPADTAARHPKPADKVETTSEIRETLAEAGDTVKRMSHDYLTMYSDAFAAALASAGETSRLTRELGQACIEAWTKQAQTASCYGRDVLTCRTPEEFSGLQSRTFEAFSHNFETLTKAQGDLFAAMNKAAAPLLAQAAKSPGRLFGALAD